MAIFGCYSQPHELVAKMLKKIVNLADFKKLCQRLKLGLTANSMSKHFFQKNKTV